MSIQMSCIGAFYDLNISDKIDQSEIALIRQLGYKTLAITKTLEESAFVTKKKGKSHDLQENQDIVPQCTLISELENNITTLNRLTIQIGDVTLLSKLNQSENIKKYDILAIAPTTQNALNHACTTMDVDIICLPSECSNNCKINRKLYKQATERGICFEIPYSNALRNSTHRKNIIQRAHIYHTIGKSKHVLITSGAENYFQVRTPYDIVNLGRILGLNEVFSLQAITDCARKVLLKADNRKRGKAAVFFDSHTDQSDDERCIKVVKVE